MEVSYIVLALLAIGLLIYCGMTLNIIVLKNMIINHKFKYVFDGITLYSVFLCICSFQR